LFVERRSLFATGTLRLPMKFIKTPGLLALSIYLILVGVGAFNIHLGMVIPIVALVAGILILIGK
jgi:hypothetical protein